MWIMTCRLMALLSRERHENMQALTLDSGDVATPTRHGPQFDYEGPMFGEPEPF